MKLFVFGLGYSSQAIALESGLPSAGTTRSAEKARNLALWGFATHVFDGKSRIGDRQALIRELEDCTHLLISIAPDAEGDLVLRNFQNVFASHCKKLEWIGYLSTVGVYGNFDGGWIDETVTPRPVSKRGHWRIAAEGDWQRLASQLNIPLAVFRLAGIYGPGRSPLDKLRAGTAKRIVKSGQVFNRIHLDDIARVVTRALTIGAAGIFNLADDEPAPPQEVVAYAAKLLGVQPPPEIPFDKAVMSPMARSFYLDNKRVGNGRIKLELPVVLRHRTYRDGLEAILRVERRV